jgi:hypothetical protein
MPDVPLTEASTLLGLRPEALRKRLQRGTVAGYKDDQGEWVVTLPESRAIPPNGTPAPASMPPAPAPPPTAEPVGGQAGGHAQAERVDTGGQSGDGRVDTGGQSGGRIPDNPPSEASEPALLRELLAHQQELLDELRQELAARRREVQQLHTLLAQAQQRALPGPEVWTPEAVNGGGAPSVAEAAPHPEVPTAVERRPWWRFWG